MTARVDTIHVIADNAIAGANKVNGKVDISVVQPSLLEIKAIVLDVTAQINLIANLGLDVILLSNGTLITIDVCAQIFAAIFIVSLRVIFVCSILKLITFLGYHRYSPGSHCYRCAG